MLRLTFLVGGEIRFGEGLITALSVDPMGGPVFVAATRLLTNIATKFAKPPRHPRVMTVRCQPLG
jgi:hypothetical protein